MITKDEIINRVCSNKEYKRICKRIADGNPLYEDLYQELILLLLEYDAAKLEGIYERGELNWFIVGCLNNMYRSNRSGFHAKYRHHQHTAQLNYDVADGASPVAAWTVMNAAYNAELDRLYDDVTTELKQLSWYEQELFRSYLREGSVRKLAAKTDIPYRTIGLTVMKVRNKIIRKVKINDYL
jgi:DNA-directed RNA polymerase specialized sigma24 family protein